MNINDIVTAVNTNQKYLSAHLSRFDKNDHTNIEKFQQEVFAYLDNIQKNIWKKEYKVPGQIVKDSIDIYGDFPGRPCIIEIDTVRHDQISCKFVSRIALCCLVQPIDYVVVLYPSTQKNGKASCEKYVVFMNGILKAINKSSHLIAIYIDPNKSTEVWDCDNLNFVINSTTVCKSMNDCARKAVSIYIKGHKNSSFNDICKAFTYGKTSYIKDVAGPSRYKNIGIFVGGKQIFVYSQFRSSNWFAFVEICKQNKIYITRKW